ncbi:hypothetical protein Turpa_1566 [Turneriella parva DSM 21527]|uniref:7TM-DISM receptor extracellular domain-containing protein n=1 Tax=Turneriella parva (strain ATCC BAA-1111 / DSM 21527 / NCTC 11395 / H) TaxID=869212 RepID=I4B4K7_TURPD|nr:hypothetical protein Turpa_1566 [Turneriella parva DSM 21527]
MSFSARHLFSRLFLRKLIFLLFGLLFSASAIAASATELPTIDLNAGDAIRLHDYPWQFYWKKLLSPKDFESGAAKPDLIMQPVTIWNHQIIAAEELGSYGYATYRLRCRLNAHGKRVALRIPAPLTSYRVYVNGELLAEAGKVGESAEDYKPMRRSALIFFRAADDRLDLVIQVANFLVYKGGLRAGIEIGYASAMQAYGMRYLAIDLFCIGLIFAIMLYHLLLFVLTRKDWAIFVFALLALNYFLLAFLFGEQSISLFLPEVELSLHSRIASIIAYLLPPLVMEFTGRLYAGTIGARLRLIFWANAAIFVVLAVFLSPVYFMRYNVFYYGGVGGLTAIICMRSAIIAIRARRPGSRLLGTGLLFLFALTIYAVYLFATHTVAGSFLSMGFALFALFQSGSLAHAHAALESHNSDMHERLESSRKALESQRKQIEANLHDSLGGNLTDIKLGLEALVKDMRARGIKKDIQRLDHRVAGTIASLRTELLFLEDLQLAMDDFISGINLILLRRYQMAKRPVDIRISNKTREEGANIERRALLTNEVKLELCMMLQELCNNNLKYGAGSAVWQIEMNAAGLEISLTGKSKARKNHSGKGAETLRRRAEKTGATFEETSVSNSYKAAIRVKF